MISCAWLALFSSFALYVGASVQRLDRHLNRELLHNGRPQIGLWQALLEEQTARQAIDSTSFVS